ncbi:hypothetical protein niasHT_017025 [Heterodera trifolii]|uniref:LNS2/PITP domain-containing protein n=1 Tax=Heterodera trifolii TaxID=157864 RepID=A0ABD2KY19_9BILA
MACFSSTPISVFAFSIFISSTAFFTGANSFVFTYKNGIKHQVNGTLSKAVKHLKLRGASDFVVIKRLSDSALFSSPLFAHFGSGIFEEKGRQMPRAEEFRVSMAVDGQTIEGMALKMDRNGIVEKRSVNLTPLAHLLRRNGRYSVRFSVENGKGRTVGVDCFLYFWDSDSKLVISDIDGTVTKSDLWGMILGNAWIQRGVRNLYGSIKQRGYKVIYLSARPASVGTLTSNFLSRLKMPSGPLLLSPEPLEKALKTAVKDPQRVKIICMKRLKDLFAPRGDGKKLGRKRRKAMGRREKKPFHREKNPFFAGFGNQPSDQLTYQVMSVPTVFMVNPKGAVTVFRNGGHSVAKGKSYRYLSEHMDSFFPHLP